LLIGHSIGTLRNKVILFWEGRQRRRNCPVKRYPTRSVRRASGFVQTP